MHLRPAMPPSIVPRDLAPGVRGVALFAALLAGVAAVYAPTVWSMVRIWHRSETYAHGFLVVPLVAWFVWQRRAQLAALPLQPSWWGVPGLVAAGALWLLGDVAGSAALAQFAMVSFVPALLVGVGGLAWLRALAFPCGLLFFAVPVGEFLVPTLIAWTADVTVAALRLFGIPVYQEGAFFIIPSGRWSVVDACSGIRYLMASALAGCLFAWTMYRSPVRRAVFVAVSLVVPIVANWLRAIGIVLLGHLSGNTIATGVDHLIYGWIFFGVVVFILFAIGSRWREDDAAPAMPTAVAAAPVRPRREPRSIGAAMVAMLLLVAWPLARANLPSPATGPLPASIELGAAAPWTVTEPVATWKPIVHRPVIEPVWHWFANDGSVAGVQLAVWRRPAEGGEAVSSANRLVSAEGDGWHVEAERLGQVVVNGRAMLYRETLLRGDQRLVVRDWYWVAGLATPNAVGAKVHLARERLLGRDDTSAWVMVVAPAREGAWENAGLDAFMQAMAPRIDAALQGLRR